MKVINVDINSEDKLSEETIYIINDQLNRYEDDEELQNIFNDRLIEQDFANDFRNHYYDDIREKANNIYETKKVIITIIFSAILLMSFEIIFSKKNKK